MEGHLQEIFATFGEVVAVDLPLNKLKIPVHREFAFVEFASAKDVQSAIDHLNDAVIDGRRIVVSRARPISRRSNDRPTLNAYRPTYSDRNRKESRSRSPIRGRRSNSPRSRGRY